MDKNLKGKECGKGVNQRKDNLPYCLSDVKPMHCKIILNRMDANYAGSTIRHTYIAMGTMYKSAVMSKMLL